jgi:NADPH:quinone reductase-like Zn-dependent oxidoreductase
MKAIIFPQYGSPDVLQYTDVDKPTPKDNQVLVKVHVASANPLDWHRMRADPFLARLSEGFSKPNDPRLGADLAGEVVMVGKAVTRFKVGDAVFADSAGAFAEYVCVREELLVHKPANVSFEHAAASPVVGLTAIQGLRDSGHIKSGQSVLINGASGGVGMFAVQYAKSIGTTVTAVSSARNHDLVRSIGADHVIDYTTTDFTRTGQTYDLIYDAIGNRGVFDLRRALKPNGRAVVAGFTSMRLLFGTIIIGGIVSKMGNRQVMIMSTAEAKQEDLLVIKDLLASGKVVPVIDRCYTLKDTAEAIRYLETGRARGKVLIKVIE